MSAVTVVSLEGREVKAAGCSIYVRHTPIPRRFIWHHILPEACGGKTETTNLVALCDNCHYAIHIMLWMLAQGTTIPFHVGEALKEQLRWAQEGYDRAKIAGTVNKIPKEA